VDDTLPLLKDGPLHSVADWPLHKDEVPKVGWGVYTVWRDDGTLIYVGIGGWSSSAPEGKGLISRLSTHASGQRSGDKFCIYVCDRLVLGGLTPDELAEIGAGRLSLDARTREYIRSHSFFRYVTVDSIEAARRMEDAIKGGAFGAKPFLQVPAD
jgi:hypothetical protein